MWTLFHSRRAVDCVERVTVMLTEKSKESKPVPVSTASSTVSTVSADQFSVLFLIAPINHWQNVTRPWVLREALVIPFWASTSPDNYHSFLPEPLLPFLLAFCAASAASNATFDETVLFCAVCSDAVTFVPLSTESRSVATEVGERFPITCKKSIALTDRIVFLKV